MKKSQQGFTLIELVVAISITAILVALVVMFVTAPMDSYLAQNRRSELIYSAQSMQRWLHDDVQTGQPNSLRNQRNGSVVVWEVTQAAGPVAYLCDQSQHTLVRYSGYSPVATLNNINTAAKLLAAGASATTVALDLNTCEPSTTTGRSKQHDLLSLNTLFVTGTDQLSVFNQFTVDQLP